MVVPSPYADQTDHSGAECHYAVKRDRGKGVAECAGRGINSFEGSTERDGSTDFCGNALWKDSNTEWKGTGRDNRRKSDENYNTDGK